MNKLIFALLLLLSAKAYSQNDIDLIKTKVDSTLSHTSKKDKALFQLLLTNRDSIDLYKRIKKINYKYLFITESIDKRDSSLFVRELYFEENWEDPIYIYNNGYSANYDKRYEIYKKSTYYKTFVFPKTFTPLYGKFKTLKNIQKLNYDENQGYSEGCSVYNGMHRVYKKKIRKRLKNTYQIQTLIDLKNDCVLISFQTPSKNPKFKALWHGGETGLGMRGDFKTRKKYK